MTLPADRVDQRLAFVDFQGRLHRLRIGAVDAEGHFDRLHRHLDRQGEELYLVDTERADIDIHHIRPGLHLGDGLLADDVFDISGLEGLGQLLVGRGINPLADEHRRLAVTDYYFLCCTRYPGLH